MLDRAWFGVLVDFADSWHSTSPRPDELLTSASMIEAAGIRPPRTRIERAFVSALPSACNDAVAVDGVREELLIHVERVVEYISDHSGEHRPSRAAAAKSAGVTASWVAHHLKAASGRSFAQHVSPSKWRLQNAERRTGMSRHSDCDRNASFVFSLGPQRRSDYQGCKGAGLSGVLPANESSHLPERDAGCLLPHIDRAGDGASLQIDHVNLPRR